MKKSSLSESSSDLVELEEGLLVTRDQLARKQNCNPRHNNNINAMSIETDVWLRGIIIIRINYYYVQFQININNYNDNNNKLIIRWLLLLSIY